MGTSRRQFLVVGAGVAMLLSVHDGSLFPTSSGANPHAGAGGLVQ